MKYKLYLVFILLGCASKAGFSQIELSKKAQEHYYVNPILPGMNPDPSICRVGDDYYLVTSSFGFYPGLPIYHSKDLVNWQLIGYGINSPSQLDLQADDQLNLYAPTLRYNNGIFYIINTNTGKKSSAYQNFIITAKNPAGPWSDAHYIENAPGIDPSLFFDDDGKVYYTGNDTPKEKISPNEKVIWTQEIDIKTWKLKGERVDVVKTADYYRGLYLVGATDLQITQIAHFEGPHLYKKNGEYFLLISHGGTIWNHAVSIWKSKTIFGPFEPNSKNPIITHRDYPHDAYLHHTGHADVIQTQNGEWWMVLLATRPYGGEFTNLGRETNLVPLDWSGEWPIVNPKGPIGRVTAVETRPNLPNYPFLKQAKRDNFDSKALNLNWNFIQIPSRQWWSLSEPKGYLKLNLRPEQIFIDSNPSFIGRRQAHKNFTAITKMEFTPKADNEEAGIMITRDISNNFRLLYKIKDGKKYIELFENDGLHKTSRVIVQKQIDTKVLYLKTEALEQSFAFFYSIDGKNWENLAENINGRLLSSAVGIGRFTGTFLGMYASSNKKESNNSALFDWFEYSGY
jgi:xylan 1,4-beta-xylosidase